MEWNFDWSSLDNDAVANADYSDVGGYSNLGDYSGGYESYGDATADTSNSGMDFGDYGTGWNDQTMGGGSTASDWGGTSSFGLDNVGSFLKKYGGNLLGFLSGGKDGGPATGKPSNAMNLLGSGIAYKGAGAMKDDYMKAWENMLSADKWNSQSERYWEPMYEAATKGIGNTAYGRSIADATARQSSAKGYNMSGNMLHEIAQGLNSGTTNYLQAMAPMAMGRAPDTRGLAPIATGVAQSTGKQYGALGSGVASGAGVLGDLANAYL